MKNNLSKLSIIKKRRKTPCFSCGEYVTNCLRGGITVKINKETGRQRRPRFEKAVGAVMIAVLTSILLATGVIGWYAMSFTQNNKTRPQCQSCEATLEPKDAYCFRCGTAVEAEQ